jgi:predicted transcriptional regulator
MSFFITIIHRNIAIYNLTMGLTKSQIFSEEQNEIARFAKVLGHPARVAILQYITKQQSCICNDLVQEIGLAQATISQHLRELKNIGILQGTIAGTSVCYCIDSKKWNEIQQKLATLFSNISASCC